MTINGARPRTAARATEPAPRTAAATEALRRKAAERAVLDLRRRFPLLDDDWIATLAAVTVAECRVRGLAIPDLLADDEEPPASHEG